MLKLVTFAVLVAAACAYPYPGYLGSPAYAPLAVAHAPVAVAQVAHAPVAVAQVAQVAHLAQVAHAPVATSYANVNLVSRPVHAVAVQPIAVKTIAAAPAIAIGHGLGGYGGHY